MKKLYTTMIALLIVSGAMAQTHQPCSPCLPDGIFFLTQSEIDSFQVNYPNCTEVLGGVWISGNDMLTSLTGLEGLTSIEGSLHIGTTLALTSLTGLEGLTSIGGYLSISYNNVLTNLMGLDNVTSIGGGLAIYGNNMLTSLTGLEGLTSIEGDLWINGNDALTNLMGLDNVTSIEGSLDIMTNYALTSLAGLGNVTSIGGFLSIKENYALTSLVGLDSIETNTISNLGIYDNPSLSTCEVQSVCDYLASPNGIIHINNNATGCNSQQEVEDACESASINEVNNLQELSIYPNPTQSTFTIELQIQSSNKTHLTISSTNGQQLITQPITEPQTEIDISHLPIGIYIVKVWNDKDVMVQKVIKQ